MAHPKHLCPASHACDEANFTYRSVTLETSASSSIPAIWFCSPPGAYKTAPFSKSLTSLLAAGCLSGGTSDPCHLSGLQRNSSGNVVRANSRNDVHRVFPSTGHLSQIQTDHCSAATSGEDSRAGRPRNLPCHTLCLQKRLEPCRYLRLSPKTFVL